MANGFVREFLPPLPVRKVNENARFEAAVKSAERSRRILAEIERLRLTDAEREAVERQAKWLVNQAKNKPDIQSADLLLQEAATLRGLLERTK
jgi:hypothetical protein